MKKFAEIRFFEILFLFIIFSVFDFFSALKAQSWVKIAPPEGANQRVCAHGFFVSKNCGWVAESFTARIWHTENGGETWIKQRDSTYARIYSINFIDSLHGWAAGRPVRGYNPFLLKTSNGGNIWEENPAPSVFFKIAFRDTLNGFASGAKFFLTNDGGLTWHQSDFPDTIHTTVISFFFVDSLYGWIVGTNDKYRDVGLILKTTDGGLTWGVNRFLSPICSAIYFFDRDRGFVVGDQAFGGEIGYTMDGGQTWDFASMPYRPFNDIIFTDDSCGWIVGMGGTILNTFDSGKSWRQIENGKYPDLYHIQFVENNEVGYAFGDDMTILRYDVSSRLEQKIEKNVFSFRLYQNYPNPFNPETEITYQLPQTSYLELTIFNLQGQKIKTLFAGEQPAGTHHVKWNGADENGTTVASGVYLCQMRAGEFVATRKMLLLR